MPPVRRLVAAGVALLVSAAGANAAPTNVRVERTAPTSVAGRTIASSSRLTVSWTPNPADRAHHIEVVATESVQNTQVTASVAASATSVTLVGMKSNTAYRIVVKACTNEDCSPSIDSEAVSGETDREHWQLRGSGHTVSGLTKAVSDGNARLSATRFGPDAGGMANRVQLYYGPMGAGPQSPLAVAVASGPADAANPDSFLTFSSRAGTSGLLSPATATPLVQTVATGQGVPVSRSAGGFVRLFFEAQGADGRTRALWIDSKDGYIGQDFNSAPASTCSTAGDYSSGGGCEPSVAIGVDGDANGNRRITNARQFKVAWPTLDAPHWDMSPGAFMVFTTDRISGCADFSHNHGYAVWYGGAWTVQYQDDGCPKLFKSAQAAFPFHSGGARYRLYYGDPSITEGRTNSNLPFLGPKKLIYADGVATSARETVEFEDWEPQSAARDVVFLWPDGQQLDAGAEGYIDDYHFLTPTGTLDLQVMYITITDGAIPPISAVAVLINP